MQLKNERAQRVFVQALARKDGVELIQVLTYCGEFNEASMAWALKTNTQLSRCALGVAALDGADHFVLVQCVPAAEARPEVVKSIVKEVAFYGDWIEKKLTGGDAL